MQALRIKTIADHGYADAAANPSKFPAGLFSICTGSYDMPNAFVEVDGVYTTKPPGGIAYRCSFRVTEAVHTIERMVDSLALRLGRDPADLRAQNFIRPEQFPYKSVLGWEYDSGNYQGALDKALQMVGYADLRREQAEKRARGELMGIGLSTFTEIVGAGPSHTFDILGIKMFDSAEIRVHPTGSAIVRIGVQSQGQGHETTFAQIVAEELGLPVENIEVEHGDTDTAPYGLGTYASRSTPTAGAATALAARKIRDKAAHLAAHLLECSVDDLEWKDYQFQVKGAPERSKTMADLAFAAYTNHPLGMEAGLEAVCYYDPPNLTFPFGAYIAVIDIDRGTGEVKVRRFVAVDDCGTVINPMVVEGQIHGGLAMGLAPALYEQIWYDAEGNIHGGTFMDYLVPTAMETPAWETDRTVTPSPHHPLGAKGVGESATVGAPPAIVNAVVDALAHLGVTHIDIPITPPRLWRLLKEKGVGTRDGHVPGDLLERAAELRRAGQPFVLATVVRSLRPSSARPGDRALLSVDGSLQGWIGGGCVHTSVAREASEALASGEPRLVRLSPEPIEEEGIVSYPMTCHSGGTLDIYLEPVLPSPELVVIGDSAVAEALATLAAPLGFRVVRSFEQRSSSDAWVVVAGMSSGEDHPLVREALLQNVPYVAMVSSRRRAEALLQELSAEGVPTEQLQRLKAPAGLDIGAANPPEIALSILAEIVQRRRVSPPAAAPRIETRPTAIDPMCGMQVDIASARWTAEKDGQTYYFCAPGCRKAFLAAS